MIREPASFVILHQPVTPTLEPGQQLRFVKVEQAIGLCGSGEREYRRAHGALKGVKPGIAPLSGVVEDAMMTAESKETLPFPILPSSEAFETEVSIRIFLT